MTPVRKSKLEALLQQLVAELLLSGAIKDYRVSSDLLISQVNIARDFSAAKLYISSYNTDLLAKGVVALNHASGFIRRRIAPKLHTRMIPSLYFYVDNSIREGSDLYFKMERDLSGGNIS